MSQPYIADFELERLALGELSEDEAQALQRWIKTPMLGTVSCHCGQ